MNTEKLTQENSKCLQGCKHAQVMQCNFGFRVICGAAKNGIPMQIMGGNSLPDSTKYFEATDVINCNKYQKETPPINERAAAN